jgi:CubicO group peptidase (beta-lactamase class C family)
MAITRSRSAGWSARWCGACAAGRSATWCARRSRAPLGAEFEIGFGPELDARVAPLVQGPIHPPQGGVDFDLAKAVAEDPESLLAKAFANPPALTPGLVNTRAWRAAEIPGANGHSNAHSLARIYAPLANGGEAFGVHLLSRAAIERARTEQVDGRDEVLPLRTRIALGFFLPTPDEPLGPNPRAFGHGGAGGSYSHADPEHRLSFGYAMNLMHMGAWLVDPRARGDCSRRRTSRSGCAEPG